MQTSTDRKPSISKVAQLSHFNYVVQKYNFWFKSLFSCYFSVKNCHRIDKLLYFVPKTYTHEHLAAFKSLKGYNFFYILTRSNSYVLQAAIMRMQTAVSLCRG